MKTLPQKNLFSKKIIILGLIFALAIFLRIYKLSTLPLGFYEEEVTNAYVGRFILQTGRDLYGNLLPFLYFDKFGDYPPVLPMYLSGFSSLFFGLNEFAARFPIAFIGALMIFPVFSLGQIIFKNTLSSFLAALFLALTPWHIVLSRTTAEGIVGLTILTFALAWLFQGRFFWAYFGFFLSYFLYPGFRILVPLILLPIFFLDQPKLSKFWIKIGILFFFGLTIAISLTSWGKGRFIQTSFFQSQEIREHTTMQLTALSYGDGSQNVKMTRIFHNKVVVYLRAFLEQYFSYYSPRYLFLEGGGQHRYYNVPYQGLILIVLAPLLLFAVIPGKDTKPKFMAFICYLLLIAPLPAALTMDFPPHVHRSLFMILPLVLLAGYGGGNLLSLIPKPKLLLIILGILLTIETIYFWHQYANHEGAEQSILRNVGDKELVHYVIENQKNYDKVIIPGFARLPIYYLYFSNNFNANLIGKIKIELRLNEADNVIFANDWCPTKYLNSKELSPKTLIIDRAGCEDKTGFKQFFEINRADSTAAYKMLIPQ